MLTPIILMTVFYRTQYAEVVDKQKRLPMHVMPSLCPGRRSYVTTISTATPEHLL